MESVLNAMNSGRWEFLRDVATFKASWDRRSNAIRNTTHLQRLEERGLLRPSDSYHGV